MISEILAGIAKKVSTKAVSRIMSESLAESIKDAEINVQKKLHRVIQHNVNIAMRKLKRELMHSCMMMFSFGLVMFGVLLMLSKYFSIQYILISAGFILFSITIISK